jgi:hypothetical protein
MCPRDGKYNKVVVTYRGKVLPNKRGLVKTEVVGDRLPAWNSPKGCGRRDLLPSLVRLATKWDTTTEPTGCLLISLVLQKGAKTKRPIT